MVNSMPRVRVWIEAGYHTTDGALVEQMAATSPAQGASAPVDAKPPGNSGSEKNTNSTTYA